MTPRDSKALGTGERYRGCLLGLAVGDAVGTTLEFRPPGSFAPIDDMVGGGPFRSRAGPVDRRHVHGSSHCPDLYSPHWRIVCHTLRLEFWCRSVDEN